MHKQVFLVLNFNTSLLIDSLMTFSQLKHIESRMLVDEVCEVE